MYKNIEGINKILDIYPDFAWHYLNYIESLNYNIDFNDDGDKVSYVELRFLIKEQYKIKNKILIKFNEVNSMSIDNIGGSYNQITGLDIIDLKGDGWEADKRFLIRDYEEDSIKFYCKSIEIVSVN